jgi:hypothetical protein
MPAHRRVAERRRVGWTLRKRCDVGDGPRQVGSKDGAVLEPVEEPVQAGHDIGASSDKLVICRGCELHGVGGV